MSSAILQSVGDLAQNGIGATIVGMVNLVAISGVFLQGWRHRVAVVEKTGRLDERLAIVTTTLKNHIANTPTHEMCLSRMAQIEAVIRAEVRLVRDDVQALTTERNGAVLRNEQRIAKLENWKVSARRHLESDPSGED